MNFAPITRALANNLRQLRVDAHTVPRSLKSTKIAVETVAAAQDELAREGYYHGPIDGVFSEDTHRAVKDFQRDNGLNETGYLSRETRNALELDVK
jgi:peptidoglycan hydrolase-like protein with peptidoglycan-binding domain